MIDVKAVIKPEKERPKYAIREILQQYLPAYEKKYKLSYKQRSVVNKIMKCRTAAMGGHILVCDTCGKVDISYNACKDRHCPNCGAYEKAQWLEEQKRWLLPIHYYHIVFTIDHVFNPLVWRNKKKLYNHLCRTAAKLLKEYGRRYLGGELGFTMVLHTWGQTMQQHPHVHVMVTGGALVKEGNGYRWQKAKQTFLFPVKELSADFRRVFCAGVKSLTEEGELDTDDGHLDVAAMVKEAESKDWEVYIQPPQEGKEKLLDYLGRYVARIAMSNHRIVKVERGKVSFEYYDNRDGGKLKVMTLTAVEFIRRFLLHVLPNRLMRIRHYGLHHGSCRAKLERARRLLGLIAAIPVTVKLKLLDWLKDILGEDPRKCPHCGQGSMVKVRTFGPISKWRLKLAPVVGLFQRWGLAT